jgi:hypothetical protein
MICPHCINGVVGAPITPRPCPVCGPTESQLDLLKRLGGAHPPPRTRTDAAARIERIIGR